MTESCEWQKGRVAVLMGGIAEERPVSLRSGEAVAEALQRAGVQAEAVDVRTLTDLLQVAEQYQAAFIALHGRWGENGTVQAILDTLKLPYTGSRMAASALAMDKLRTKLAWRGAGLPTPAFEVMRADAPLNLATYTLGFPVMVKPAREGSSIGIQRVETPEALHDAVQQALRYDDEVLVEQWIEGEEYTAAIVDGRVLPLIRLETPRLFYDYEAKYHDDRTRYHCPCGLDPLKEAEIAELCRQAFELIGAEGWGRVDVMVDEAGQPWLIELNTVPGMTDHSLVPMAARVAGWSFEELVCRILQTAR